MTPAAVQHLVGFTAGEIIKFSTKKGKLVQYYKFNVLTGEFDVRFLDSANFYKPDQDCPICSKEAEMDVAGIEWKG